MTTSENINEILSKKITASLVANDVIETISVDILNKLLIEGRAKETDWNNLLTQKFSTISNKQDETK